MTLDELIRVEDALDAMKDTPVITGDEYARLNKPEVQSDYLAAWQYAEQLIRQHGTQRKALNEVQRRINDYR